MVLNVEAYEKTGRVEWAQMAIIALPYALRYKSQKTKLLLAPIFKIISSLHGT